MTDSEPKIMTETIDLWKNNFVELKQVKSMPIGIAVATENYIPIADFKEAFLKAEELSLEGNWKAFIFDKSELDTFHQPSMEWYYTQWKKNLANNGLQTHFKILPPMNWFKTSVEAGIVEIKEKNPDFDFGSFKVQYVKNLAEAINIFSSKNLH